MGVRALIEVVMVDKIGDQGTFNQNMKAFVDKGYLSGRQVNVLESVLGMGHAAIHRGHIPTHDDVVMGMSFAESLIQMVYVHESQSTRIASRTPQRRSRNSASESDSEQ